MDEVEFRRKCYAYKAYPDPVLYTELMELLNTELGRKRRSWILSALTKWHRGIYRCLFCGKWMDGGLGKLKDHFVIARHGRAL